MLIFSDDKDAYFYRKISNIHWILCSLDLYNYLPVRVWACASGKKKDSLSGE
jgi:hypothetical protein